MRIFATSIALLAICMGSLHAQPIRFLDIVQKPSKTTNVEAQLNERGGSISFDREYRTGCVGGYRIQLSFSTSLNMLQPGETFRATLSCVDCSTPCGYKWGIVDLLASGGITSVEQYPNYVYNGNIESIGSSNGSSGVNDWDKGMMSNVITLKYEPLKEAPLTGFKLVVAGDHEIYYLFETDAGGAAPEISGPLSGIWSGWGTMTLSQEGGKISGTYSDTYSSSDMGVISLFQDSNGEWTGTWEEPGIERRGTLHSVEVSDDGRTITGKYDVTEDGGKGNMVKGRSFTWTYRSPSVK